MRAAWLAGVASAAMVFGCYSVWRAPDRVVGMLGGATGMERTGGVHVRYRSPPGREDEIARALGARAIDRDGPLLVLGYPGLSADDEPALRVALEQGGLRMREVLHDTSYAAALFSRTDRVKDGPVRAEVDQWTSEHDHHRRTDYYLMAPTRQEAEQAVADAAAQGLTPAEGSEVGYERVEATPPSEWSPDGTPAHWRTYVLRQRDDLDGSMIRDAEVALDPGTARPYVHVELTEAGAQRLCEITGQIAGSKFAAVLGTEVVSAPILNGRLCGKELSISMGGDDPQRQARDARTIVHAMATAALPRGGRVMSVEEIRPAEQAGVLLLARALLALAGGALVALTTLVLLRGARPRWAAAAPRWAGRFPWRRLAVTALAPAALLAGSMVRLPGVNLRTLNEFAPWPRALHELMQSHVTTLGVMPVLSAYFLVEVIALAVPGLRWRRHAAHARMGLGRVVAALTIALALVQGWFIAHYLSDIIAQTGTPPGALFHVSIMASLTCGTLLLAWVAGVVHEHGLGNGYGALATSAALLELVELARAGRLTAEHAPAALALAGTAAITWALLRWRIDDGAAENVALRVPTSGTAPMAQGMGLVLVLSALVSVGLHGRTVAELSDRLERALTSPWIVLALTLGLTALWSWLQARPALLAGPAALARAPAPDLRGWTRAMLLSAVGIGAVALMYLVVPRVADLASATTVMMATALVMDQVADARALGAELAPAAVLHQVQRAGVVEHALARAGIPCHLRNVHLRTLLAFFGPHVPVAVLVPAEHGARARALLAPLSARPQTATPAPSEATSAPSEATSAPQPVAEAKPAPDDGAAPDDAAGARAPAATAADAPADAPAADALTSDGAPVSAPTTDDARAGSMTN